MAKKNRQSTRSSSVGRHKHLPILLALLAVSVLVSLGVIIGSLHQDELTVLGAETVVGE